MLLVVLPDGSRSLIPDPCGLDRAARELDRRNRSVGKLCSLDGYQLMPPQRVALVERLLQGVKYKGGLGRPRYRAIRQCGGQRLR